MQISSESNFLFPYSYANITLFRTSCRFVTARGTRTGSCSNLNARCLVLLSSSSLSLIDIALLYLLNVHDVANTDITRGFKGHDSDA
jgi:hypothetical protein